MFKNIVLDSNVLIKLFWEEKDSDQAQDLVRYLIENDIQIIGPQLLVTETMDVCLSNGVDPDELLRFFENRLEGTISLTEFTPILIKTACSISTSGNPKSGFPSYPDSSYHAVAIEYDTVFITADNRHLDKTKKEFGKVILLKDWKEIFTEKG